DMGDDELLYRLITNSKDKLAANLAKYLWDRTFYENFFEFSRPEAEAVEEVRLLNILEQNLHADSTKRLNEEDRLSEVYANGNPGDVLIYCPDKKMALKEAEMLIMWKQENIPLFRIEDKLARDKISSVLDSHKKLWTLRIFVAPAVKKNMYNGLLNEALLREWCRDLVKAGEDKDRHLRSVLDMTILDVLQKKGIVLPKISQTVSKEVHGKVAEMRERGGEEPITRKHIESVIDSYLGEQGMKKEGNKK
ncbi:unnamed protein product, partial [marine sediment metagenome]